MARDVVAYLLLGLAVLVVAGAGLGILLMRDAYSKLHFVTPAALVAPVLVTLALLVRSGLNENTGETCLALVFLVIAGQFAVIATVLLLWVGQDLSYSPGWVHPMAYYFAIACGIIAVFGVAGLVLRRGSPRID